MVAAQPSAEELVQLNQLLRRRLNIVLLAGAALGVGVLVLFAVVWFDAPGMRVLLGVNILLVFAVAVLDQQWRRCPKCDYSLVPYIVRMEVEDSRECPRCELNLDLLNPPPA